MLMVSIFRDGDAICALYGEDIQEGVAGFGENIPAALSDLAHNWEAERGAEVI